MANFKPLTSIGVIAVLSFALSGCVSETYSYDGYRNDRPSYGGFYSGPEVVYRAGPRYNSRYYRDDRSYRERSYRDRPYRERTRSRPERPADYSAPTPRPDRRRIIVPSSDQPNNAPDNQGVMRIIKRESHN